MKSSSILQSVTFGAGVFALAFAGAIAAKLALQQAQHGGLQLPAWFGLGTSSAVQPAATPPAAGALPAGLIRPVVHAGTPVASAAPWDAAVMVGPQRYALAGDAVALPTDTRFRLNLSGLAPGRVSIYAQSPQGTLQAEPVFQGWVTARGEVTTPMLRLTGSRGQETLWVVHQATDGPVVERPVRLWHL